MFANDVEVHPMGAELPLVLWIGTWLSFSNTFFFPPFWDLAFLSIIVNLRNVPIFYSSSTSDIFAPSSRGASDLASQASVDDI